MSGKWEFVAIFYLFYWRMKHILILGISLCLVTSLLVPHLFIKGPSNKIELTMGQDRAEIQNKPQNQKWPNLSLSS